MTWTRPACSLRRRPPSSSSVTIGPWTSNGDENTCRYDDDGNVVAEVWQGGDGLWAAGTHENSFATEQEARDDADATLRALFTVTS